MLLGHWWKMRALAQTTSALDSLAALLPDEAEKVEGEHTVTVSPADLRVGDVVVIRPGGEHSRRRDHRRRARGHRRVDGHR